MNPEDVAVSGSVAVAAFIATLAGLLSLASPCILPVVTGYIGAISSSNKPISTAIYFAFGVSSVFISLNTFSGATGYFLVRYQEIIIRLSGVVIFIMGLIYMGVIKTKFLIKPAVQRTNPFLLGLLFSVGWTPCMGPVLVAVNALSLSGNNSSVWRGFLLGVFYCIGLGLAFLLIATGWNALKFLYRYTKIINIFGGLLLLITGIFMLTGVWAILMHLIQESFGCDAPL